MACKADKETALRVLRRLRSEGHTAYFAGGCVRDMLLGRRCKDYDIATDATPRRVRTIFRRVVMVGAKFGVAVVLMRDRRGGERMVEVATFRTDISYTDGRRPDGVRFVTPREDAERRDFTINGMFYDPVEDRVIDYVGGQKDLEAGVIRTIGSPERRFAEDYLRMLRAVRFSARLAFSVDSRTLSAIRSNARAITRISGERIFDELTEMLGSDGWLTALRRLDEIGLAGHVMPELFEPPALWKAGLRRLEALPSRETTGLKFGVLLSDLPPGAIREIARRWGAPNRWKKTILYLSEKREEWRGAADAALCDFKRLMSGGYWRQLLLLWKIRERIETGGRREYLRIVRRAGAIAPGQVSPEPFVKGRDLQEMGLREGRRLGRLLRELYDAQLNEQIRSRRSALAEARKRIKNQ